MAKNKKLPELARTTTRGAGYAKEIKALRAGSDPPDHLAIDLDGVRLDTIRNTVATTAYRFGTKVATRISADRTQLVVLLKEDADRLGI